MAQAFFDALDAHGSKAACGSSVCDALDVLSKVFDAMMLTTRRFCVAQPFVLKMCRMVKDD